MGGIVTRLAMTLPNHRPGTVKTIFTIASPHLQPVLSIDKIMGEVYRVTNSFWSSVNNTVLKNVDLIVINPTARDRLISAADASIEFLAPDLSVSNVHVGTMGVCPTHNGMIACKVVVKLLAEIMHFITFSNQFLNSPQVKQSNLTSHLTTTSSIGEEEYKNVIEIVLPRIHSPINYQWLGMRRGWGENATTTDGNVKNYSIYAVNPFGTIDLPELPMGGWREYNLFLDLNGAESCKGVIIKVAHPVSGEEYWYNDKCKALIRFGHQSSGIMIEYWIQNPNVKTANLTLKQNWVASFAHLLRENFQYVFAAMITFCLQLVYYSWKTRGTLASLTDEQTNAAANHYSYHYGRSPQSLAFLRTILILIVTEFLQAFTESYHDHSVRVKIWERFGRVFFATSGISFLTIIITILRLSMGKLLLKKSTNQEYHSVLATSSPFSFNSGMYRRLPTWLIILGVGAAIFLPIAFTILFSCLVLWHFCWKSSIAFEEFHQDELEAYISLSIFYTFLFIIQSPTILSPPNSLRMLWMTLDPISGLTMMTLPLLVRCRILKPQVVAITPRWLQVLNLALLNIVSISIPWYGTRHLHWPIGIISRITIPLLFYILFNGNTIPLGHA